MTANKARNLAKATTPIVARDVLVAARDSRFLPGTSLTDTLGADLETLEKEHEDTKRLSKTVNLVKKLSRSRISVSRINVNALNNHKVLPSSGADESNVGEDKEGRKETNPSEASFEEKLELSDI